ncbi:right-handed parallel beta-helix repeat-containing protein [Spirosoma validum]|uniref:Right-handed parallel beta-helix repeat-containing protein n=1 Tax=Spirosoma validum TaxID=2771355 RepID=A0A927GCW6_9BACT|nr:right-handed parallel beta-helix repeat-containing protein [Spirosoma validum]MBD2753084.1 right-handed parallel beta-helix repeat-containing protein [Spirosoma validum]
MMHRLQLDKILFILLITLSSLLWGLGAQAQSIRYVREFGTGDGRSWDDASSDLQAMIDDPGAQQVWVAQGNYKPTTTTDRSISFKMKEGVAIYGGFSSSGNPSSLRERNPNNFMTVLDGDIGRLLDKTDNSYHVIRSYGLTNSAILDGFLITNGYANSNWPDYGGAGMLNNYSSPTLRNCVFYFNEAKIAGGAMGNEKSSPLLINCVFIDNKAGIGGAIENYNSAPMFINVTFSRNSASTSGGAIWNDESTTSLTNCVLFENGGKKTLDSRGLQTYTGVTATYTLFDESVTGYSGTNNLTTTTNPFRLSTMIDVELNPCSPAVNGGSNAANTTPIDLAGNPRIFGAAIDMGAYELQTPSKNGLTITLPSVTTAVVDQPLSLSFTASGGTPPYRFGVLDTTLPASFTLSEAGVLSGALTQAGTYTLTVLAQETAGCTATSGVYTLTTAPIRYVRQGGTGDGSSWALASGDLQAMINVPGDHQVWVAQGTYKPTTTTDRSISFSMKNKVTIYGGFAPTGTSTTLAERMPGRYTTLLSGDIGLPDVNADNSYHVINNGQVIDRSAILDGFTISYGNADDDQTNNFQKYGGGMLNHGAHPTIRNCLFSHNAAISGGGIMNFLASAPTLINCAFTSNTAREDGGAIYFNNSRNVRLINCSFLTNSAGQGGAVHSGYSSYTIVNGVVFGNGAGNTIQNVASDVTITNSLLEPSVTNYAGSNNLLTSLNPFVSTTEARLNSCSSAINAGNNAANTTTTDLAGNPRIFGTAIDMGASEFQYTQIAITLPSVNTALAGQPFSQPFTISGSSAPYRFNVLSSDLPPSLSLSRTGVLSGTPTQAGSFTLAVQVKHDEGCMIISPVYSLSVSPPAPDLVPILYARPSTVFNNQPVTVVVDIVEIGGASANTPITLRITKQTALDLSLPASATAVGGREVDNSHWRLSTDNPNYYVLTTTQPLAAGSKLSVGLSGMLMAGTSVGTFTISGVVEPVVGETRINNNIDADKVNSFQ